MRLYLSSIVISLLLIGCTVTEKPEFVTVRSLDVVNTSLENFTVEANIIFLNKNGVGGTLEAKDFHVLMDSIDIATVTSKPFHVPKKEKFELPLRAVIPFEKVFKDTKQNLLNAIMHVISKKKITLTYKGDIRYKLGVFHYDYPVAYKQEILLQK